ncbi:GL15266 [Drosophila persimilis]|uniref:GL15266 n=1 Tax=Drosophila persimilis TaxID=7234 RepID=B4GPR8_DROPE|nr:GL15266 [Drosophila persimilis]
MKRALRRREMASTPESLPSKRDEANSATGSSNSSGVGGGGAASGGAVCGAASGAASGGAGAGTTTPGHEAAGSPTVSELGGIGPNATINGQVARHGSLTIIRRTNSRNFSQIDAAQLTSPSTSTTASGSISFAQAPLSEPLAERLSSRHQAQSGANGSARSSSSNEQGGQQSIAQSPQPPSKNAALVAERVKLSARECAGLVGQSRQQPI